MRQFTLTPLMVKTLKGFIISKKLYQKDMAVAIGASPYYLNYVLNGKRPLTEAMAKKISLNYGFSVEWLLSGNGDVFEAENPNNEEYIRHLKTDIEQINAKISELQREYSEKLTKYLTLCENYGLAKETNINA